MFACVWLGRRTGKYGVNDWDTHSDRLIKILNFELMCAAIELSLLRQTCWYYHYFVRLWTFLRFRYFSFLNVSVPAGDAMPTTSLPIVFVSHRSFHRTWSLLIVMIMTNFFIYFAWAFQIALVRSLSLDCNQRNINLSFYLFCIWFILSFMQIKF